jgi:hypothetical protein
MLHHVEDFSLASSSTGDASAADAVAYVTDKYPGSVVLTGADVRIQNGWGTKGLSMGKDGSASSNFLRMTYAEQGTIYVACAYNPRNTPIVDEILTFRHLGVQHITIQLLGGSNIRALRGSGFGVELGTAYGVLRPGRVNHLEVKVTISDTVGVVEIRVDGVAVLTLTSQDTKNGGTTDNTDTIDFIGAAAIAQGAEAETVFSDIIIRDDDWSGPIVAESLLPDGAGDLSDWTPSAGSNFQNVDEIPKDGDTTYNETATANDIDLFTMGNLAVITSGILGIKVDLDVRATAGSENIRTKVRSGATTADGASQAVTDTVNFITFSEILETDPDTASAWTVSGINAIQAGYEHL